MTEAAFSIHSVTDVERAWVLDVTRGWGDDFVISRGRKLYPAQLEGFFARDASGKKLGLISFEIIGDQCEAVILEAFKKVAGIGTALLYRVRDTARARGCRRLWLITTNDNLDAIRFYQRRGMTIAAVHVNALEASRRMKPTIPLIGQHGIPLRDEIEFEMKL